ncbi:MAG: formate C-acetyltransferase/glycerol dehydratase family glycyl radical enzyme, partial [Candidatus Lokiarchaeota archaeon]|nr:formate C-acetyltransferase/glycerol dehydratase family glycyl radical enzyme [Candidatus Lokiarchaeota archaeon]MBD3341377.1 formate C-acetyltransferase/glycerol dehydratase family glycyl radical enzyme [Candidatus Lokiarchaeota archaeon]
MWYNMAERLLKNLVKGIPHISIKVPLYYTKALKDTPGKPMIIRQAEGLKSTLENLPIIIRPDELIVGTFDEDIPVAIPRLEGSGFRIMNELETLSERAVNPIFVKEDDIQILREELAPYYEKFKIDNYARELAPEGVFEVGFSGSSYIPTEIGGIAHAVVDYPRLLSKGLKYYMVEAQKKIDKYQNRLSVDPSADDKVAFYKAMKIICEAMRDYAHKYSKRAERMAKSEANAIRRKELLQIAATCKNISENPPYNIQEAIQFVWFIHMALHIENFEHGISFGRIDQYLYTYFRG